MIIINKRIVIIVVLLLCIIVSYFICRNYTKEQFDDIETPVYCLMVTGYDKRRRAFALNSITNFTNQTYKNKHLVIINQDLKSRLLTKTYDNMLEVMVDNTDKTLGELRNISLQFVPPNAVWTTWDDDDWRSDDYIKTMVSAMEEKDADFLMFTNRIEYNLNTNYMYEITLRSGLMTFFAKANPFLVYADVSTSEDKAIKDYAFQNIRDMMVIVNNDPLIYVRAIHDHNTSVYAKPDKDNVKDTSNHKNYFERRVSSKNESYLRNILSSYYKKIV